MLGSRNLYLIELIYLIICIVLFVFKDFIYYLIFKFFLKILFCCVSHHTVYP